MAIGKILKMLRTASGMDQRAFCERMGMSLNFLSQVENGRRMASRTKLGEIEEKLGLPRGIVDFLAFRADSLEMGEKVAMAQREVLGLAIEMAEKGRRHAGDKKEP